MHSDCLIVRWLAISKRSAFCQSWVDQLRYSEACLWQRLPNKRRLLQFALQCDHMLYYQKVAQFNFFLKSGVFQNSLNSHTNLDFFWKKICTQELSKIAQSGYNCCKCKCERLFVTTIPVVKVCVKLKLSKRLGLMRLFPNEEAILPFKGIQRGGQCDQIGRFIELWATF